MYWPPFRYQRKSYDLTHLHPKTITYIQPANEKEKKPAREYLVDVIFSLHCFTRGGESESPEPALFYSDDRETRVFDFRRYALSLKLPGIIDQLMSRKCFHTGKDNFFTVELADEAGNRVEYEIYFTLSMSSTKGVLNLFIQSAYVRDPAYRPSRPKVKHWSSIRFGIILYNTLNNLPIKVPK